MIDPALLTKENGFEDGVVVEIIHRHSEVSKLIHGVMGNKDTSLTIHDDLQSLPIGIQYSDIVSIRPLTGPMAIWNFAPEWAVACMTYENRIDWCEYLPPENTTYTGLSIRPFWATRNKRPNVP